MTSAPSSLKEIEYNRLMQEIMRFRASDNDIAQKKLQETYDFLCMLFPSRKDSIFRAIEDGKKISRIIKKAKKHCKNDSVILKDLLKEASSFHPSETELTLIKYLFTHSKEDRTNPTLWETEPIKWRSFTPESRGIQGHPQQEDKPFFLSNIPASPHWRIYIDETGHFPSSLGEKGKLGKMVALFIPDDYCLPDILPGQTFLHATDENSDDICSVLKILFEHGDRCGILGCTLEDIPVDKILDSWYTLLERLICLALRLLNWGDYENTTLELFIENRGDSSAEGIKEHEDIINGLLQSCLYNYVKAHHKQSQHIHFKFHVIAKKESQDRDFLNGNAYVDTLACSWAGKRKELIDILKHHGLLGTCLLRGISQDLYQYIDRLQTGENIPSALWRQLLNSPDRATRNSLVSELLQQQGELLRSNPEEWQTYVNELVSHLNSKAINLRLLSEQLDWLTQYMPPTACMPKRLQLLWLTCKLATANHHGDLEPKYLDQLKALVNDLFLEDAPLCCYATLNLAVAYSNAFHFQDAKQILLTFASRAQLSLDDPDLRDPLQASFAKENPSLPVSIAIYGLRYYGQLLSSLGQQEAFLGNHEKADQYFDAAIHAFQNLSESQQGDIEQTLSYKVINLMDFKDASSILPLVEEYLGGPLDKVARTLATSSEAKDKYKHAIMLRYFMELPPAHPAIQTYLSLQDKWKRDQGHPWEIIDFYRALLAKEKERKEELLSLAYNNAHQEEATLRLIALVIYGGMHYVTPIAKDKLKDLARKVITLLPQIGEHRIEALRNQVDAPIPPLELAKIVLPFNFR